MSATLSIAGPDEPTEAYLSTSLQPSYRTRQPTRKLLVLDLNGTLVYRFPPPPRHPSHRQTYSSSDASPAPSRLTYPRPYFPSFRQYLFHPLTRAWLDVMVWSSAQPHSVRDMLKLCFPQDIPQTASAVLQETTTAASTASISEVDDRFFAVWARDTLGLSKADYSRKVQTTKNLEKIWTEANFTLRPTELATSTSTALDLDTYAEPDTNSPSSSNLLHSHSLTSTILLDDSPLKARLQPWNHLCVREYGEAIWKEDTRIIKSWSQSGKVESRVSSTSVSPSGITKTNVTRLEHASSEEIIINATECSNSNDPNLHLHNESIMSSKTIESKIESLSSSSEARETQFTPQTEPNQSITTSTSRESHESSFSIFQQQHASPSTIAPAPAPAPDPISDSTPSLRLDSNSDSNSDFANSAPSLDETLLAIIGVLEELKHQSNVCGWLRNRGLWSMNMNDEHSNLNCDSPGPYPQAQARNQAAVAVVAENQTQTQTPEEAKSVVHVDNPTTTKATALQVTLTPETEPETVQVQAQAQAPLTSPWQEPFSSDDIQNMPIPGLTLLNSSPQSVAGTTTAFKRPLDLLLGDVNLGREPTRKRLKSVSTNGAQVVQAVPSSSPRFWFEDKDVFAHWVREGKRALRELAIEEHHGLQ